MHFSRFIISIALVSLTLGLTGCGNWKLGIPGTEPRTGGAAPSGAGNQRSSDPAARRAELRAQFCRARTLHGDAGLATLTQVETSARQLLPHRREVDFRSAFASGVAEVVLSLGRFAPSGGSHTPQEYSDRARALAMSLSGSLSDVLAELMRRNQIDESDPCLPYAISEVELRFLRGLDPFAELTWPSGRPNLVTRSQQTSGSYQLALPSQVGDLHASAEAQWTVGNHLTFLRWEDDEVEKAQQLLHESSARAWVLDFRSAAGVSDRFADVVRQWAAQRSAENLPIVIWVDRFTRGQPEVIASELADRWQNVLLIGERTLGYVRAPCLLEEPAVIRLACRLMPGATDRLERLGVIPEVRTTADSPRLEVVRRRTLTPVGPWGLRPPRNPIEIRAIGQNNSSTPQNRFVSNTERTARIHRIRSALATSSNSEDDSSRLSFVLQLWASE